MFGKGILHGVRGDGSLIRALLVALVLQILMPAMGVVPAAASPTSDQAITVCTAHGIVTLVPDGNGGWTQGDEPRSAGLACAFCLPLLSGNAGPVADLVLPLPVVVEHARKETAVVLALSPVLLTGASSPRAPPALH